MLFVSRKVTRREVIIFSIILHIMHVNEMVGSAFGITIAVDQICIKDNSDHTLLKILSIFSYSLVASVS